MRTRTLDPRWLNRSSLLVLALALCASAVALAGCGDDEVVPDPVAKVFFLQNAPQLGNAEIWANDKFLLSIMGGQQTTPVEVPTGSNSFQVRLPGAAEALTNLTDDLKAQTYLYVVGGDLAALSLDSVGGDPGAPAAGKANVEAVYIVSGENPPIFDAYVGGVAVASAIQPGAAGGFVDVDPGKIKVELYNEGDTPGQDINFAEMEVEVAAGGSYMLLLRKLADQPKPTIQLIRVK